MPGDADDSAAAIWKAATKRSIEVPELTLPV